MTTFSVTYTRFVIENSESRSSEGFLFHVVPKMTLANGKEEIQEENAEFPHFSRIKEAYLHHLHLFAN